MKIILSLFFISWCFIVFAFAQQTTPTKWENVVIESTPHTMSYLYQGDVLMEKAISLSGNNNYRLRKYLLVDDYTRTWSGVDFIIDKYSTFITGGIYHIKGNDGVFVGNAGTIVYPDLSHMKIYQSLYHYYIDKYVFHVIFLIILLVMFFLFRLGKNKQRYVSQKS